MKTRKRDIIRMMAEDEITQTAAEEVLQGRRLDRSDPRETGYRTERDAIDYVFLLGGIGASLSHVRKLKSNLVVDIGCGSSKAIAGIRDSFGEGLDFIGTTLSRHPDTHKYLGSEKVRSTSATRMRGFQQSSVGGILSVHSISHSNQMPPIAKKFEEILVPGGVAKVYGVFETQALPEQLKSLGFDVEVEIKDQDSTNSKYALLMLAVKPGNSDQSVTAKRLMQEDLMVRNENVRRLMLS